MADVKLLGNGDLSWNDTQSPGYFELERFQAVKSGTLKSIRVYFYGSNGVGVKVAIYSDNSGSPNALLASGSAKCNAGWNTISVSDVAIVSGTYYWLGHVFQPDKYSWIYAKTSGGTALYKTATYSSFTFPNPAGTGFTNDTWTFAHAGWGAESAGGAVVPVMLSQYRRRVARIS